MKACKKCGKVKHLNEFPLVPKNYKGQATHRGKCLECKRAMDREYIAQPEVSKKRSNVAAAWIKERKKTITFEEIPHGTPSGQPIWGCKCRPCVIANLSAQCRYKQRPSETYTVEDHKIAIAYRIAIDKDSCYYCGKIKDKMETDHIIPLKKGGLEVWSNLRKACKDCNLAKGPRDENEFLSVYLASDPLPEINATAKFYNLLLKTYLDRIIPLRMIDMEKDLPHTAKLMRMRLKELRATGHITRKPVELNDSQR